MRTSRFLLLVLAALIAGCGSGDDSGGVSDKAVAKATLMSRADLPTSWQETRPLPLVHCGSNPFRDAATTSKAHFAAGLADLQQEVAVFKTEAEAEEVYAELTSQQGFACFRKRSENEISSYSGGPILKPLRVLQEKSLSPSAQAKRTKVEVSSPIGRVGVYIDVAYAQAGRTVMFLKISCGLEPVEKKFFQDIASLAVQRVRSASEA